MSDSNVNPVPTTDLATVVPPVVSPVETKVEEYVEPLDWSITLGEQYIDQVKVLVMPKNENSSNQKHRVVFVPPDLVNNDAPPEVLEACDNVEALCKPGVKYPKLTVLSAIMKLFTSEEKMAAPGQDSGANKQKEKPNGAPKETPKISNLKRSFWLTIGDLKGLDPDVLEAEGGEATLLQKQILNRKWLHEAQKKLAMKFLLHPACVKELKKKEAAITRVWKMTKPDVTWPEVVMFQSNLTMEDHAAMGIFANMPPNNTNMAEGIAFGSNVWYLPTDPKLRTDEMNEKKVKEYVTKIADLKQKFEKENFIVNETYCNALRMGLREHVIPVYRIVDGEWQLWAPHPDPCKSNLRSGDFIKIEYYFHPYDNEKGAGQTLCVNRIFVLTQGTGEQVKTLKLNPMYSRVKSFQPRYIEPPKEDIKPEIVTGTKLEPAVIEVKPETQQNEVQNANPSPPPQAQVKEEDNIQPEQTETVLQPAQPRGGKRHKAKPAVPTSIPEDIMTDDYS